MIKILLTLFLSLNAFSSDKCRQLINDYYQMMGKSHITPKYSSTNLEELELTTSEFNNLNVDEQTLIFEMIKPMSTKVIEVSKDVHSNIIEIATLLVEAETDENPRNLTDKDITRLNFFLELFIETEKKLGTCEQKEELTKAPLVRNL
ncbi:MAG: hypothetical protein N4A33_07010 [Bacteriovoracaceae bacterium]|jgi:hypothetical protein|nr:hypothetical protein [Bacteriovoracaceae bacterium]